MRSVAFSGILFLVLLHLPACGNNTASVGPESSPGGSVRPEVHVMQVHQGPILTTYTVAGSIVPAETARISPKISGRIVSVSVDAGDRVSRGDLLMLIDPVDYEKQYEHAAALMNQARVSLERAQRDFSRIENLYELGAVSEQNFQDARTGRDVAHYQYDQAVSAWKMAEQNLKECRITAPIPGIITMRLVNEGELTGPQSQAFVIMDMDTVKVEVDLPERIFSSIHQGGTGLLTVDAFPADTFTGTITQIHPTIDPGSRTFMVTITLNNEDLKLRSGMTARVQVVQQSRENAIAAPKASIVPGEHGYFVYKAEGDSVKRVEVGLGIEGDDSYEIISGLGPGDWVVVRGITGLTDGMKVKSNEFSGTAGE